MFAGLVLLVLLGLLLMGVARWRDGRRDEALFLAGGLCAAAGASALVGGLMIAWGLG